jgi:hypothetical protein
MVAPAGPCGAAGACEERVDFGLVEVADERVGEELLEDAEHAGD